MFGDWRSGRILVVLATSCAAAPPPEPPAAKAAPVPSHAPPSARRSLDPLPNSACTITVEATPTIPLVFVSQGFSPRVDGLSLPLTITSSRRFRAAFLADRPFVEIEQEGNDVALRAQATFEDVRLFPRSAVQLTPSLVVRRGHAVRVDGDRVTLGFELPKGLELDAPLPPLERSCAELDPNLSHLATDHVQWCQLSHRALVQGADVPLFDDHGAKLGSLQVDSSAVAAVLETKGKRAKITIASPSRDTMLTAWLDTKHLGDAARNVCPMPSPPPRSEAPAWICDADTPLTLVDAKGQERLVGFARVGQWTLLDKNACGREVAGDLVLDHCYAGRPTSEARLVVKGAAAHCHTR